MKRQLFLICAIIVVVLSCNCGPQLAGSSSEITNGYCLIGLVPVKEAIVIAFPIDYVPFPQSAMPETTFTDDAGYFSIQLEQKGWNLLIYDSLQIHGAFVPLPSGDSTLGAITLDRVGSIVGIVNTPSVAPYYAGIYGSPFYVAISNAIDTFELSNIPPFLYALKFWEISPSPIVGTAPAKDGVTTPLFTSTSVMVLPDSITTVTVSP